MTDASGHHYEPGAEPGHHHDDLAGPVLRIIAGARPGRILDLGCGNGSFAARLAGGGFDVVGIDPSEAGIRSANRAFLHLRLESGSAYEDLAARLGTFSIVISIEVVEHLYDPRSFARTLFALVEPGGTAIVSTPYHGYLKNVALALSGRMDAHLTALWDHGHIKFRSIDTLRTLMTATGFADIRFERVGRVPLLAKSMIAVAEKPRV